MKFASVRYHVTHFSVEGPEDAPTITFINSLGTDLRIWEQVTALLDVRYQVVRYDKRGHGLSDRRQGPYSLDDFVVDLGGLLTHLSIETTVLVGISLGGLIAMEYAARYPGVVPNLILCDTAARIGTDELWKARIETVSTLGMEQAAPAIIPIWFADTFASAQPAIHQGLLNMMASTPTEGYVASCAALRDADLTDRVGDIQAETLVLTGEHDRATPPSQGEALANAIPNARFEQIEGAGHLPCIEQSEVMASKIDTFLKERNYV